MCRRSDEILDKYKAPKILHARREGHLIKDTLGLVETRGENKDRLASQSWQHGM